MDPQEVTYFLQQLREREPQNPMHPPLRQRRFTFRHPHKCKHCGNLHLDVHFREGSFPVLSSGPSTGTTGTGWDQLNLSECIAASTSGCELFRWVVDKLAQRISTVYGDWQSEPQVMAAIVASGRCVLHGYSGSDGCWLTCTLALGGLQDALPGRKVPDEVQLGYIEAWAPADDPASGILLTRPYGEDVRSRESINFARSCLQTCMERHAWCRADQIGGSGQMATLDSSGVSSDGLLPAEKVSLDDIPTRLLDVGSSSASKSSWTPRVIRLVETEIDHTEGDLGSSSRNSLADAISTAGFVALSYCWGGDQPVKLLQSNRSTLKQGIDLASLPQTLQDAVWVARETGFRYLWVDALCILQDDDDGGGSNPDKAVEITRMSSYYGRATLTLCAASAQRCTDGFLHVRHPTEFAAGPIEMRLRSGENQEEVLGSAYLVERLSEVPAEPTTERGWTFQESLLSRRILIFARRQLYWSCLRSFAGCGGNADTGLEDRMGPAGGVQTLVEGIYPVGSLIDYPVEHQWSMIVGEYTKRSLGRSGDKLLAISSLASYMVSLSKHRAGDPVYAAGLLVDNRDPTTWLTQLLWYPETAAGLVRPEGYRAPTWSWASVDGPVRIDVKQNWATYAAVDSWDGDLAEAVAPYGAVTRARITLLARTRTINDAQAAVRHVAWASRGDAGPRLDGELDHGAWGQHALEGSDQYWTLILMPDTMEDKQSIGSDLSGSNSSGSSQNKRDLLLVALLPLDGLDLAGVRGLVVEQFSDGSGSPLHKRLGTFQLRAGRASLGVSSKLDTVVHRYFTTTEERRIEIV